MQFLLSFLVCPLLPAHCRCRELLFLLIKLNESRARARTRTHTHSSSPLDEGSALRRDLYLTTHNTHKRQTSMLPVSFEPVMPGSERPQTYALYRAHIATGALQFVKLICILPISAFTGLCMLKFHVV